MGIRLSNGRVIKTDPKKEDTDDDGIIDSKDEHIWKAESLWVAELLFYRINA